MYGGEQSWSSQHNSDTHHSQWYVPPSDIHVEYNLFVHFNHFYP